MEKPSKVQSQLRHYGLLVGILILATVLRFWNLGEKPLWLDEVITALISLGRRYEDVPLDTVFSPARLPALLTLQPDANCTSIAATLATHSTHPPLFFCLMHAWLGGIRAFPWPLAGQLRALTAMFGVGAIASIYLLNRLAFSPLAGLFAAAIMAVSPFGVYLSQEARQYSLGLLLLGLALTALIKLAQTSRQSYPWLWLGWGIANSLGCYVHYFFLLAFVAQFLTLALVFSRQPRHLLTLLGVTLGVFLSYLPWLPTFLEHFNSPTTGWLPPPDAVSPFLQLAIAWLSMLVVFPVEGQPLGIQIASGLAILSFGSWAFWQVARGLRRLVKQSQTRPATLILGGFAIGVLLQFLGITYLLGKDITVAPRYSYVYYPALSALIGASFWGLVTPLRSQQASSEVKMLFAQPNLAILSIGFISSMFVCSGLVFQKPYAPEQIAQRFNQSEQPLLVIIGYNNPQEIALGLSYGLTLEQVRPQNLETNLALLNRSQGYDHVWEKLATLAVSTQTLWVVAPGLKQAEFPANLRLNQHTQCQQDLANYFRLGFPFQRYECDR